MTQLARIFKANCCLKVHNANLKLASSISGYGLTCAQNYCLPFFVKAILVIWHGDMFYDFYITALCRYLPS